MLTRVIGVDKTRYLECLAADAATLRAAVHRAGLDAGVPTCPGWTAGDLIDHVSEVYEHKIECIRQGREPESTSKPGEHDPFERFDAALASITAELTVRDPGDHAYSWYEPDQTVGFWVRRMPHETVIHRADAERASGGTISPIPEDLGADGVDEALTWFLKYANDNWADYIAEQLPEAPPTASVDLLGGIEPTRVSFGPKLVAIGPADTATPATAQITGPAGDLDLWLWGRKDVSQLTLSGNPEAVTWLRRLMVVATQ